MMVRFSYDEKKCFNNFKFSTNPLSIWIIRELEESVGPIQRDGK